MDFKYNNGGYWTDPLNYLIFDLMNYYDIGEDTEDYNLFTITRNSNPNDVGYNSLLCRLKLDNQI